MDVDLALGFASHYSKIETMDCLVEEGNAVAFLSPLMRAAERGCVQVVEWFVKRGCREMELCLAVTAATSSSRVEIAAYLLPHVPRAVLAALSVEILKAAGERSGGSFNGVEYLLKSDFLGDPVSTYSVADTVAKSEDESVPLELKTFLQEHWSEAAFKQGVKESRDNFLNFMRVLKIGESGIRLKDLPAPLRVAIAYMPLYRGCVKAGGRLLSQKLRGQLVEAVKQLQGFDVDTEEVYKGHHQLMAVLEHHLPIFLVKGSSH